MTGIQKKPLLFHVFLLHYVSPTCLCFQRRCTGLSTCQPPCRPFRTVSIYPLRATSALLLYPVRERRLCCPSIKRLWHRFEALWRQQFNGANTVLQGKPSEQCDSVYIHSPGVGVWKHILTHSIRLKQTPLSGPSSMIFMCGCEASWVLISSSPPAWVHWQIGVDLVHPYVNIVCGPFGVVSLEDNQVMLLYFEYVFYQIWHLESFLFFFTADLFFCTTVFWLSHVWLPAISWHFNSIFPLFVVN